jgi:C4-dicarboxylate-specific signal transduction histidine kinase
MRRFHDLGIARKLTIINTLTSGVALVLTCAAIMVYELIVVRAAMISDLSTTATIIGDNSAAALTFGDAASAEQTLRSLNTQTHIVAAVLYGKDGNVFARYQRPGPTARWIPPTRQADGHRFVAEGLELFRSFKVVGEQAGTVYIRCDLTVLKSRMQRYALIVGVVLVVACAVAMLLSAKLQTAISEPIAHLAQVANSVSVENNYSLRARKRSNDELGRLIDGFNAMLLQIQVQDTALQEARSNLEQRVAERTGELQKEIGDREQAQAELQATHKQLLEASRQAGRAEVATSVLHNVGNVLNSVNVSLNMLTDYLERSQVANLPRVAALLEEHGHELGTYLATDPRGRHLPDYLQQLAEQLLNERTQQRNELTSLCANVEHIKKIVAMQQAHSKVGGVKEMVSVVELLEDTLRIAATSSLQQPVEIRREFAKLPLLNAERHKILQILVNLVRNAQLACIESQQPARLLVLRAACVEERIRISVIDNGVGIAPENLNRIFSHGFTTRKDGHGFGLHSSALAARELGGSLHAYSEGTGCGATFVLELPLQESLSHA